MRLAFICHEFPPIGGGAATALDALTRVLAAGGHSVSILTVRGPFRQTNDEADSFGRHITRLPAGRTSILSPSVFELIRSYAVLRRHIDSWVEAQCPDALIAYFAFPSGFLSVPSARKRKLPLIVSFRGSDLPGFSRQRWGTLKILQPFILKRVWRHADVLCANGESLFHLAQQFKPSDKIRNVPNGVDTSLFRPPDVRETRPELRLLFVGQLIPRKRCREILEGARNAAEAGTALQVTFVGDGPLAESLKEAARSLPPTLRVDFAGWKSREDLPEIYQKHDVLVQVSEAEGISNVVLEALACGLPVLGSSAAMGGVRAPAGRFPGLRLDPVSSSAIGEAICRFGSEPDFLRHCSESARKLACGQSWEAKGREFEELLAEVLPDRPPFSP